MIPNRKCVFVRFISDLEASEIDDSMLRPADGTFVSLDVFCGGTFTQNEGATQ
jgi:hypothetical protein